MEGHQKFLGGGGVLKAKILEAKSEVGSITSSCSGK